MKERTNQFTFYNFLFCFVSFSTHSYNFDSIFWVLKRSFIHTHSMIIFSADRLFNILFTHMPSLVTRSCDLFSYPITFHFIPIPLYFLLLSFLLFPCALLLWFFQILIPRPSGGVCPMFWRYCTLSCYFILIHTCPPIFVCLFVCSWMLSTFIHVMLCMVFILFLVWIKFISILHIQSHSSVSPPCFLLTSPSFVSWISCTTSAFPPSFLLLCHLYPTPICALSLSNCCDNNYV